MTRLVALLCLVMLLGFLACEREELSLSCPVVARVGDSFEVTARMSGDDECRGSWSFVLGDDAQAETTVSAVVDDDGEVISALDGGRPAVQVARDGGVCVARATLRPEDAGLTLVRAIVDDKLGQAYATCTLEVEALAPGEPKPTTPGFSIELDVDRAAIEIVLAERAASIAELAVTVDWAIVPQDALSLVEGGDKLRIETTLAPGIHDVRVEQNGELLVVKVHREVSYDWRDAPIYFAMTDRFENGDPANDAPLVDVPFETNFQGGDFAGIQRRIESGYFDELGVGSLWISWPAAQPTLYEEGSRATEHFCGMQSGSYTTTPVRFAGYHGYWPASLDEVDPRFGTMEDLQSMVNAAHVRGIRVLLDFTANHLHDSSSLWRDFEDEGYFHTPMATCNETNWSQPETCWFDDFLPDLDYTNAAVRELVVDKALWWAKQTGADGFRFDAVKHLEMSFVEELRTGIERELEHGGNTFYVVGETFTGDAQEIAEYLGAGRLHAQFDFPGNLAMLDGFGTRNLPLNEMDARVRAAKTIFDTDLMSNFVGNHDISRFLTLASGELWCGPWEETANQAQGWLQPPTPQADRRGYDLLELALVYAMTTPGVPLIYYGDEYGQPGAGDPDNRRFMRFDDELTDHEATNLSFVRALGRARRDTPALRRGDWSAPLFNDGEVLSYARTTDDSRAVILLNRSDNARQGSLDVGSVGVLADSMQEQLWNFEVQVTGGRVNFDIPPRSAWVLVE